MLELRGLGRCSYEGEAAREEPTPSRVTHTQWQMLIE